MGINSYNTPGTTPIERLAALAGVVKTGKETYDAFKDSARKSEEMAQAADPNSPIIATIRQHGKTVGIQIPENMNYRDAKQAGIVDTIEKAMLERQKQGGGKSFEQESGLRKEWVGLPTTKATQDVAQSIERVRNAYSNTSPAGDLSLLYAYMKMIDPGSTVRESEFSTAAAAGSIPEQMRAQWAKVVSGQRLTPEQRYDFANQAEKMYGGQLNAQKTVDQQYSSLAQRYGVNPAMVMTKFPDPRDLKQALKQEEKKPGFFASLFGMGAAQAAPTAQPNAKTPDFNAMSDDELYKLWSASKGRK